MLNTGIAPNWLCFVYCVGIFIALPTDAWLRALPASIKFRNRLANPRYHHEIED